MDLQVCPICDRLWMLLAKHLPTHDPIRISQRFWSYVEKTEQCWIWVGPKSDTGYGNFYVEGRYMGAHRWSYIDAYGSIPENLTLDHLCRIRACVNPSHLEPVTQGENARRGDRTAQRALFAAMTHCRAGHLYSEENTYFTPQGYRHCRTCGRIYTQRAVAKRRALIQ